MRNKKHHNIVDIGSEVLAIEELNVDTNMNFYLLVGMDLSAHTGLIANTLTMIFNIANFKIFVKILPVLTHIF